MICIKCFGKPAYTRRVKIFTTACMKTLGVIVYTRSVCCPVTIATMIFLCQKIVIGTFRFFSVAPCLCVINSANIDVITIRFLFSINPSLTKYGSTASLIATFKSSWLFASVSVQAKKLTNTFLLLFLYRLT